MGHDNWSQSYVCKTRKEFDEAFRDAEKAFEEVEFYHESPHWYPDRELPGICSSEEKAHDEIRKYFYREDNDYSFIVQFRQKRTTKMVALEERILKAKASLEEYSYKHSIHRWKSKTTTCDWCKTRIVIASVKGEECPYCHFAIRKDVEREINRRYHQIRKLEDEYRAEKKKADNGEARCLKKDEAIWYLYCPTCDYHF